MPRIRQLSPSVINKIAAGEVIERPASVVKELLENALDAGSTRIDVTVEQGGMDLIRIVDNGCGMAADQLELAISPHATSKLESADDLFRVATLGFRGEALASIAEVSQTTIRSRETLANGTIADGAELLINGGERGAVQPCGAPPGTLIEVRQLFFNTPVRRKFMRSVPTELAHITEAVTRCALAFPRVHFTLRHGAKLLHDLPPTTNLAERIGAFFGAELANDLLWVESRDEAVWLRGFVAKPNHNRANNRMQYLFLNGRAIRDRSLQHALSEAYRGIIMVGRYPVAFLQMDLPPESVDVNVHPTKLEVRFQDGGRLYSQLLGTLRAKFLSTDLTAKLDASKETPAAGSLAAAFKAPTPATQTNLMPWDRDAAHEERAANAAGGHAVADPLARSSNGSAFYPSEAAHDVRGAHDPERAARLRAELVAWAKGELGTTTSLGTPTSVRVAPLTPAEPSWLGETDDSPVPAHGHAPLPFIPFPNLGTIPPAPNYPGRATTPLPAPELTTAATTTPAPAAAEAAAPLPNGLSTAPRSSAIQIHNSYLVAETASGLVVIDQHALHERILYEQIRTKVLSGAVEVQKLLVPEPVDLNAEEANLLLSKADTLLQLGIAIEGFGGGTVLVSGYPAMLANFQPADVLREIAHQLGNEGKTPERRDLLDELLHMVSCKAAIKAGDRLTPDEVNALVALRDDFQDSHHCPHGRPTMLTLTREELDKQFKRT
jgi:DNA mismatch repair protein MutL